MIRGKHRGLGNSYRIVNCVFSGRWSVGNTEGWVTVTGLWTVLSVGDDLKGTGGWVTLCVWVLQIYPGSARLPSPSGSRPWTTHSPTCPYGFQADQSGFRSLQHTLFPVPSPGEGDQWFEKYVGKGIVWHGGYPEVKLKIMWKKH